MSELKSALSASLIVLPIFLFSCIPAFARADESQVKFTRPEGSAPVEVSVRDGVKHCQLPSYDIHLPSFTFTVPAVDYAPSAMSTASALACEMSLINPRVNLDGFNREVILLESTAVKIYRQDLDPPSYIARKIQRELALEIFLRKKNIPIAEIFSVSIEGVVIQEAMGTTATRLLEESHEKYAASWTEFANRIRALIHDPDAQRLSNILMARYSISTLIDFNSDNAALVLDVQRKKPLLKNGLYQFALIDW